MIVNKVARKQRRRSNRAARARAGRLGRYIYNADALDQQKLAMHEDQHYLRSLGAYSVTPEKVLATTARNLGSADLNDQLKQMDALIRSDGSDTDRIDHWVLSWDASDNPTVEEMFDAFSIFNRCMGVENCPSLIGLHGNTGNLHGHQAVLRIDPATGLPIDRPFYGWDIDAAHRALAVIEDRYPEWKVCPNRLYEVKNGRVVHRATNAEVGMAADPGTWAPLKRTPGTWAPLKRTGAVARAAPAENAFRKIDAVSSIYEEDTGWKSRKRVAIEEAVPELLVAKDWLDAHARLAKRGIALEQAKHKSGANLVIDGRPVKASIDDRTSFKRLEKRWGAFKARPIHLKVADYVQRPLFPQSAERAQYYAAKREFSAGLAQMIAEIRSSEEGYKSSVRSKDSDPAKLMRPSFPSFEDWTAGVTAPEVGKVLAGVSPVAGFAAVSSDRPVRYNIEGFEARVTAKGIAYSRVGERYKRPAIFDAGPRVYVNDGADDSIRIALRIMQTRHPGKPIKPFGPPEFLERVAKIAADEKILLTSSTVTVVDMPVTHAPATKIPGKTLGAPSRDGTDSVAAAAPAPFAQSAKSTRPIERAPDPVSGPSPANFEDRTAKKPETPETERVATPSEEKGKETAPVKLDPRVEAAKAAAAAMAARWGRG